MTVLLSALLFFMAGFALALTWAGYSLRAANTFVFGVISLCTMIGAVILQVIQ